MTVNTSDNRYGTAQLIVAPTIAEGANYTTIASALTAAVSGQTIFIRPGLYTENLTLKAGVNLCGYVCDGNDEGATTSGVTIKGKCTCTYSGQVAISGVQFRTNGANSIEFTGANASNLDLTNCTIYGQNFTAIASSGSGAQQLYLKYCTGFLEATYAMWDYASGNAELSIFGCRFFNFGASTVSNTFTSTGKLQIENSTISNPITTATTSVLRIYNSNLNPQGDTVALTVNSTAAADNNIIANSRVRSATVTGSAIVVGAGATLQVHNCSVRSDSATTIISGAGTVQYSGIACDAQSNITATTATGLYNQLGKYRAGSQPYFQAYVGTSITSVTGDGTTYTIIWDSENFDIGSNFNVSTGTFTAPVTGKYLLTTKVLLNDLAATNTTINCTIVTTARTYLFQSNNTITAAGSSQGSISVNAIADMTATDTATVTVQVTGATKIIDVQSAGNGTDLRSWWTGQLLM